MVTTETLKTFDKEEHPELAEMMKEIRNGLGDDETGEQPVANAVVPNDDAPIEEPVEKEGE